MSTSSPSPSGSGPSRQQVYDSSLDGTVQRPNIPLLWSDRTAHSLRVIPRSLQDYRALEGEEAREKRLRAIWKQLPRTGKKGERIHPDKVKESPDVHCMTQEGAESLRDMYREELMDRTIGWKGFLDYVDHKEDGGYPIQLSITLPPLINIILLELWSIFHNQLDLDGNGHLDASELREALKKAGIQLSTAQLSDFMTFFTSSPHSHSISFPEFRDFLLLLPRRASAAEMYRYYEVRKFIGDDGHGVARVNMEGVYILARPPRNR